MKTRSPKAPRSTHRSANLAEVAVGLHDGFGKLLVSALDTDLDFVESAFALRRERFQPLLVLRAVGLELTEDAAIALFCRTQGILGFALGLVVFRSEERRVGIEWVRHVRDRGAQYP